MTQSGVPNISQFNYQDPVDLVTGLEKNVREDIADKQAYFQGLIQTQNHLDKVANSKYKALYDITSQGAKLQHQIWEEVQARKIIDDWNTTDEEYDVKWKGALNKTKEWEANRNLMKGEENAAVQSAGPNEVDGASQLAAVRKPYDAKISTLRHQGQDYLPFLGNASQNLVVTMPGGKKITLATASNSQEYQYALGAIRKTWLMQAVGSKGDPVSNHLIRRHLYGQMKATEDNAYKNWAKSYVEGIQAEAKHTDKMNLYEGLKGETGGEEFLNHVNRWLGDPKFGGSRALARKNTLDLVVDGIKEGYLNEEDVNKILDHEFTPDGWPEGKTIKFRDHWKKDADKLRSALSTANSTKLNNMLTEMKTKSADWVEQEMRPYLDGDKDLTLEALIDIRKRHRKEHPNVPLPEILGKFETDMEQDDMSIYDQLVIKASKKELIKPEDYAGISSPKVLAMAKELAKTTQNNLDPSSGARPYADAVAIYQGDKEAVALYEGNPLAQRKYQNILSVAIAEQYQAEREAGKPHDQAYSAALKVVSDKAKVGEYRFNPDTLVTKTSLTDAVAQSTPTIKALAHDSTLATTNVRLPGETDNILEQGWKYYSALQRGEDIRIPDYWKIVGEKNKGGAKAYLEGRLQALGMLKDGDLVETKWEKQVKLLPPNYQRDLTHKPTDGKTYNIAAVDARWMVKSFYGSNNNDYDTVYEPKTGNKAELEKPLSQHTVGEVIELINQGYTGFGGFNLSNRGLKNILLEGETGLGVNDIFDKNTQDRLLLHSLRYKIRRRHGNTGIDTRWKRQINFLSEDEQKKFDELIPGLSYMNQIQNLLPAAVGTLY